MIVQMHQKSLYLFEIFRGTVHCRMCPSTFECIKRHRHFYIICFMFLSGPPGLYTLCCSLLYCFMNLHDVDAWAFDLRVFLGAVPSFKFYTTYHATYRTWGAPDCPEMVMMLEAVGTTSPLSSTTSTKTRPTSWPLATTP